MFWKKKDKTLTRVFKRGGGRTNLTVRTSVGTEIVTGVTAIVERHGYIVFSAQNGGGFLVKAEHFISAIPYD